MFESERQQRAARVGSALVSLKSGEPASQEDFQEGPVAILIHGFTADATYMIPLGKAFRGAGFSVLLFEYPCHVGIDNSAKALRELLECQTRQDLDSRFVIVGHSMGGLVASAFIYLEQGDRWVKKVITLGTPHAGTLQQEKLLVFLASLGEKLSGLNPRSFNPSCRSGLQLIRADGSGGLIEAIQSAIESRGAVATSFHSISGGYSALDFGKGFIRNHIANRWLQSRLNTPNDGLVEESSAQFCRSGIGASEGVPSHINDFSEYPQTNHSYLIENQYVTWRAIKIAQEGLAQ